MTRIIDLTFLIHEGMTTYPVPWHVRVEIAQLGRFGAENRETRKLVMSTHTGTHVDAPRHFIPGGNTVEHIPLDTLIGPAYVADFTDARPFQQMQITDFERKLGGRRPERLVMRFDWSDHWTDKNYYTDHPFISEETAQWLVRNGVKLLGMDTPQAENPRHGRGSEKDSPIHKILLGQGVVLVEYLCNLRGLKRQDIQLIVLPLKVKEGDGAPARCVAIES